MVLHWTIPLHSLPASTKAILFKKHLTAQYFCASSLPFPLPSRFAGKALRTVEYKRSFSLDPQADLQHLEGTEDEEAMLLHTAAHDLYYSYALFDAYAPADGDVSCL